jgi:K+-transporting ATPase KdpF subunit
MSAVEFVVAVVSVGLFAYLVVAMFKPEWFE